jgi:uncharacterized protein YigE (DUF2233 family)
LILLELLASFGAVQAQDAAPSLCNPITFEQSNFVACAVDPARYAIELHHSGADGSPYGSVQALATALADGGLTPLMAMNAGMYLEDRSPQGLYIEAGRALAPLRTNDGGDTNFYLLPNGVFAVESNGEAVVLTTEDYLAADLEPEYATQSGPMLVIDGRLHPEFAEDGTSRFVRNGVGVRADGVVVFAISLGTVSFGRFARLFRDRLATPNALYLDGYVSSLWDGRTLIPTGSHPAGPIVIVSEK